jgi:hypothetical protein
MVIGTMASPITVTTGIIMAKITGMGATIYFFMMNKIITMDKTIIITVIIIIITVITIIITVIMVTTVTMVQITITVTLIIIIIIIATEIMVIMATIIIIWGFTTRGASKAPSVIFRRAKICIYSV